MERSRDRAYCFVGRFIMLAAVFVVAISGATRHVPAFAQSYPTKPITVVIPNTPGGSSDPVIRLVGAKLGEAWGQQVLTEYRSGANGVVGYNAARARPADGYTLFLGNDSQVVTSPHLDPSLGYVDQHFVPVIQGVRIEYVLAVHPSVTANTVSELIDYLKANKGKVSYAHTGTASIHQLSMELLKSAGGLAFGDVLGIPYKGSGQYLIDMVAGQVQLAYGGIAQTMPHVRAGKLRAIGIGATKRLDAAPGVPAIAETYAGFETSSSWDFFAPIGTPADIVKKLNTEINSILAMPDVRERLIAQAMYPIGGPPEALSARMKADYEKWGAIIRKLNLKAE